MTYQLNVQTSPGAGLLSRQENSVLFIPQPKPGADALLAAFNDSKPGGQRAAVAEVLIEHDLTLPAFALVDVGPEITLRAFGDLEIRTDLASVPLLAAGSSETWVDHVVYRPPTSGTITVGELAAEEGNATEAGSRTSLVEGIVHAGGFTASLVAPETSDGPDTSAQSFQEETPRLEPLKDKSELMDYVLEAFGTVETTTETTSEDGPGKLGPDNVDPAKVDPGEDDTRDDAKRSDPEESASLTGSHPSSDSSIGRLVFDDGHELRLTGDIVLGRNPGAVATASRADPVVVTGDRVSRAHLRVRVANGHPWIEDCESRNGSVVVGAPGQQPFELLPGSPQEIDDGAMVYLGSRSFTFNAEENTDDK